MSGSKFIVFCVCLLCGLLLLPLSGWAQKDSGESALAIVNGVLIPEVELDWEINQLSAEMSLRNRPLSGSQLRTVRARLIDNIIEREVLYQQAEKKSIRIRSQWVKDALSDLKDQLGGTTALNNYLKRTGMTGAQLNERLRKGLAVRRLLRKDAIHAIKVSEAEMQAFYRQNPQYFDLGEQIRVRHILLAVQNFGNESERSAAWEKIQTLMLRIQEGADFAIIALEYSDCPSRVRAGDLGYLTRDQLIPDFADAAFELQPGEMSGIVKTRFGYHLIKAVDRRPPSHLNYKEARPKIERTIRRNKENRAVKSYVAQLKSQADISRSGMKH